jgi:hypothetical protein
MLTSHRPSASAHECSLASQGRGTMYPMQWMSPLPAIMALTGLCHSCLSVDAAQNIISLHITRLTPP